MNETHKWPLHRLSAFVLLIGLAVTVALSLAASAAHRRNERRLLVQRTREAAAVFSNATSSVQTPLASGSELVEATNADPTSFRSVFAPLVGAGQRFASVSVWRGDGSDMRPVTTVGSAPLLESLPADRIRSVLGQARAATDLSVFDLLDQPAPRLGYGYTSAGPSPQFVVYAEAALPANRTQVIQRGQAFEGLDYAIYFGRDETDQKVLLTSVVDLPLRSPRAVEDVPFGDTQLRLVMTPRGELGGALIAALPWLIAAAGAAVTVAGVALTERLVRQRAYAQGLAVENRALYQDQRTIAQTLQRSLLPEHLPDVAGVDLAARYEPGVDGVDIGGDWYDVITLDRDNLVFAVGDVSGRGLAAAATMASLRFSTRAYALEGHAPNEILTKLSEVVDVVRDGHFATMLCASVDTAKRRITIASAGHPAAVVLDGGVARLVECPPGPPIGVAGPTAYDVVTVDVTPGATVLAFTDGLFERRGEIVDDGLERVRRVAATPDLSLDELLTVLMARVAGDADDTAILALRRA
jgi:serine phosphatase RsbU (regulator of sigma subunit)